MYTNISKLHVTLLFGTTCYRGFRPYLICISILAFVSIKLGTKYNLKRQWLFSFSIHLRCTMHIEAVTLRTHKSGAHTYIETLKNRMWGA